MPTRVRNAEMMGKKSFNVVNGKLLVTLGWLVDEQFTRLVSFSKTIGNTRESMEDRDNVLHAGIRKRHQCHLTSFSTWLCKASSTTR